ncbi:hypothetical protein Syun_007809 [Stephania yunnanensis]|uniref:Uncharacterized protein n=1 Tax=Stephania yunnanensis TaxID=152371 RepID=A0AAP0PZ36_9MAGN
MAPNITISTMLLLIVVVLAGFPSSSEGFSWFKPFIPVPSFLPQPKVPFVPVLPVPLPKPPVVVPTVPLPKPNIPIDPIRRPWIPGMPRPSIP